MIKPTVGRIVWFYLNSEEREQAAIICDVINDREIVAHVFDHDGEPWYYDTGKGQNVFDLVQPGDPIAVGKSYCTWMPYQVKKTTGSESGEQEAGTQAV